MGSSPASSSLSTWGRVLALLAAFLAVSALIPVALLVQHRVLSPSYTELYVVVPAWAAVGFPSVAAILLGGSVVVRRKARTLPGQPGSRAARAAILLVVGAGLALASVWAVLGA